jgi:hypothetical protein
MNNSRIDRGNEINTLNLVSNEVVGTDNNVSLISIPYTSSATPDSIVYRDISGNVYVNALYCNILNVLSNIVFPYNVTVNGTANNDKFDVYMPDGITKLINANTSTGIVNIGGYMAVQSGIESFGNSLFNAQLTLGASNTANQLLLTDGIKNIVSSLNLPSGCSATSMSLTTPSITGLTASRLLQTDSSGNMITSNNIGSLSNNIGSIYANQLYRSIWNNPPNGDI